MPVPKPNSGESQKDFIGRCMSQLVGEEGKDKEQAAAICFSTFRKAEGDLDIDAILKFKGNEHDDFMKECMAEMKDEAKCEEMFKKRQMMKGTETWVTLDEMKSLCPKCAEAMRKANLSKVNLNQIYKDEASLKAWFEKCFSKSENAMEIQMFDPISKDTEKTIANFLKNNEGKDVVLKINSPGGNIFPGIGIFNLINDHTGKVIADIYGIAYSMMSLISMGADEIIVHEGSRMMLHNPFAEDASGDYKELGKTAEEVEELTKWMAGIYARRTGLSEKQIMKMMEDVTYLDADEAVRLKFADRKEPLKDKGKLKNHHSEIILNYKTIPRFVWAMTTKSELTDEEKKMLEQLQKKLGVQTFDAILTKIDELLLQGKAEPGNGQVDLAKIEAVLVPKITAQLKVNYDEQLKSMTAIIDEKDGTLQILAKERSQRRLNDRNKIITELTGKYINAAQAGKLKAAYVDIDLKAVDDTEKWFETSIEAAKAGGEVFANLSKESGDSTDDNFSNKTAAQELDQKAKALAAEKKIAYRAALDQVKAANPELVKRYNNELTVR
jgi:ATP-dependent protease ClpP protease subunit